MIERQFRRRVLSAAVLARRMVSQQDVLPRERATFKGYVDVFRQTNHRWCVDGEFLGMEHVTIVLFHPRYPFKDHDYGAPFGAHVNGLKGGIKD